MVCKIQFSKKNREGPLALLFCACSIMCGFSHQKDHYTDCFDFCNSDKLVPVFSDMKIPGLVMVPPATPSKRKISWRCSTSKMCLRSLQLRNVLVWCHQIMFFTHHLLCVARSGYKHVVNTDVDFRFQTISSLSHWNDCQWFDQEEKLIKIGRIRPRHHDQDDSW